MIYFDSHSHIYLFKSNFEKIIKSAINSGVKFIINSAIDVSSTEQTVKLHHEFIKNVFATAGIHPEILIPGADIYKANFKLKNECEKLRQILINNRNQFVAVGECGLDFYWLEKQKQISQNERIQIKKKQKILFLSQIELANEYNLPLVIHSRGAEMVCLDLLKNVNPKNFVLFHSFTGSLKVAQLILESGYFISFNNIITYKNAFEIREIVKFSFKNFPNQILTETDCPFLPPDFKRGEECFPEDVKSVVSKIAEITGISVEKISRLVFKNGVNFFGLS